MSISEKLAWEIQVQNDRGDYSLAQRTALEVAYGVSLALSDPGSFSSVMASIVDQVSNQEMGRLLALYTKRGLKQ